MIYANIDGLAKPVSSVQNELSELPSQEKSDRADESFDLHLRAAGIQTWG
jgi:hypothetical protein